MISSTTRLSTGTKPAPIPWILCGPGGPRKGPANVRLDRDGAERFLSLFEDFPTPVIVPPVPTPATRISTLPSVSSRSFGGGLPVDLRIGRVVELLGMKLLGVFARSSSAFPTRPFIPFGAFGQHELGAEDLQQLRCVRCSWSRAW